MGDVAMIEKYISYVKKQKKARDKEVVTIITNDDGVKWKRRTRRARHKSARS